MVRMSDLVRGLSPTNRPATEPAPSSAPVPASPATPPAAPPDDPPVTQPPAGPAAPPAPAQATAPAPAPSAKPRRERAGEAARRGGAESRPPVARVRLGGLTAPAPAAEPVRTDRPPGARPELPPVPPPPPRLVAVTLPAVAPVVGESAPALFAELQGFLERVRDIVKTTDPFPWAALGGLVTRVVTSLERSSELFWLANNPAVPADVEFLAWHQARVTVLATQIGANVGYEPERLHELGMAGCLFDVGLWQFPAAMLRRLDALSAAEQTQYRAHPRVAAETIQRWGPPTDNLLETVLQHHEREQGQGFPQGLQGASIHPDAKILGLVDTYAAMTTPASTRPALRPHEAIREIVRSRHELFAPALIKALLSEVSVFPPGTPVRLNTGEAGTVVAVNRNHPLRPRVEIADAKGGRPGAPKVIDLSEAPFVYITGSVENR